MVETMGRLSTHVLDTASGRPAAGVAVEMHRLDGAGAWQLVKTVATNADGRTDEPLLAGDAFKAGTYMLSFHIGDYFRSAGVAAASPPFSMTKPGWRGLIHRRICGV